MAPTTRWVAAALAASFAFPPMSSGIEADPSEARESLEQLAEADPAAYGSSYDASRQGDAPSEVAGQERRLRSALTRREARPDAEERVVPAPKDVEKGEEGGGVMGLLSKHKLVIGGALLGGIIGFLFGGPIGMLVGGAAAAQIGYLLSK